MRQDTDMKIYCSRYKTSTDILDSIVGKPIWVKAYTCGYKEYPYYIRILESNEYGYYKMIIVNDYWVEQGYDHSSVDASDIMKIGLQPKDTWSVFKPLEVYTSDEFLDLIDKKSRD